MKGQMYGNRKPFVNMKQVERDQMDYSSWDYYQQNYDPQTSKVNLYYRSLIEEMQSKFLNQLDCETMRAKAAEESAEKTQIEMRAVIGVI